MKIRGQEVLLPTTLVGAYTRPIWFTEKVFTPGVDAPEFPSYRIRELYQQAVALAVKDMEDAGLDIVTDGAQYYEHETNYEYAELFHYMAHRFAGYRPYGERIVVGAFDLPIYKPTVVGPVRWERPAFKPVLEAVQRVTNKPIKINCSLGPATLAALSTDRHYNDIKALAMDVARAYNEEFKDLTRRGIDMIQVTEPLTFFEPADWILEAINTAFDGVEAYKVVHICYGHEEGQHGILELKARQLCPWIYDLNVDQIHMEHASHNFEEIDKLKDFPKDKTLAIGVINIKNQVVESPEQISAWIRKTMQYVPPEQLCISTDCAIASFRRVVSFRKLQALVEGTKIVRAELEGKKTEAA
ncbi:MAG: hypothetical protein WBD99_14585 [Thermodesulfobacteriota bacterium]